MRGKYYNSIDAKNRLIIPAKFRGELKAEEEDKCVMAMGLDECLVLYPEKVWEQELAKYDSLPSLSPEARRLRRFFYENAYDCEIDKQGRTVIPPQLREMAKISGELVTIGMGDRMEIWAKEVYESSESGGGIDPGSFSSLGDKFPV
jgi:MraZ protein